MPKWLAVAIGAFALAGFLGVFLPAAAQERMVEGGVNKVRVGVLKHFPPHYLTNPTTGKPSGFAVDIMNAVAERAGLSVDYVVYPDWRRLNAALKAREVDVIANLGITVLRERWAAFTTPVETFPVNLFVRASDHRIRSSADLAGKRVSVRMANVGVALMEKRGDVSLIIHETWEQALLSLLSGNSDALIYPRNVLLKLAREAGLAGNIKVLEPPLREIKRAIGVRPDRPALLAQLNDAVVQILPTASYNKIFRKWYGETTPYWSIGRILGVMVVLMVVMALSFVYWRYRSLLRLNANLSEAVADRAQTRRKLETMIATSPDGIVTIDARGDIKSFNPTAEKLFGYMEADVVGQNVKILMPEPYQQEHDGYINRYLETGVKRIIGIGREVVGQRKDGTSFPMELAVGEMEIEGAKQFTGFIRDISRRREAEEELEESQVRLKELQAEFVHVSRLSAMGEMAATLAHELNQPLAAMMNYAQATRRLLEASAMDEAQRLRELMSKAIAQANRAGEIIRRLRSFVSQGETDRSLDDISDVVNEACALALVGARSEGVETTLNLANGLPLVLMDRIQIQQVIVNLIRNSLDATIDQDKRAIFISTALSDNESVEVSVSDNGPGLDKEVAERLFQPFNSSKSDGMGIGLSISRTIVEQHGGRIWATPKDSGGVTFSFTLLIER
jgi:two-component system sensor kinase FixL